MSSADFSVSDLVVLENKHFRKNLTVMIQNWEPNWLANCQAADNIFKFASHWSAHSEADHICKFAFHWLAQVSTDQSEALLGVYTVKPPCLGFAAEDLSSNTPLPRLRLGGFTLKSFILVKFEINSIIISSYF